MEVGKPQLEDIHRISGIFRSKGWDAKSQSQYEKAQESVYSLIERASPNQKELYYELTERYIWITGDEYFAKFENLMNVIGKEEMSGIKKIYFIPIVKRKDINKIKSGHHCIYILQTFFARLTHLNGIRYEVVTSFDDFASVNIKNDGTEIIFLVDDFIGSGETLLQTLTEVQKNPEVKTELLRIVALVIHSVALKKIENQWGGIKCYFNIESKKGISEYYNEDVKDIKINIMKELEAYIVDGHFPTFGFNMNQALVTMMKTPDNTFPIFWLKSKIKGKVIEPPFPRI